MAWLCDCRISGLRNIEQMELREFGRITLIQGLNGAGKTSVLEAISLLGLGRSFRHQKHKPLINRELDQLSVQGSVKAKPTDLLNRSIRVVKNRKNSESLIELQDKRCLSAAELADVLPLQLIDSEAFELIKGSPDLRRQYIDWGVFHVEHQFYAEWKRFRRVLKQRNNLLRRGKISRSELEPWDNELVSLVNSITEKRQGYLAELDPIIQDVLALLWPEGMGLEIIFKPGWDSRHAYRDALERSREQDIHLGYTMAGSHRADLKLNIHGQTVSEVLSRGQLKLLASSLKLAQAMHLRQSVDKSCVILIDDLPAELDSQRRQNLCDALGGLGCQVVITCIDETTVGLGNIPPEELRVFHVEHGKVVNHKV